MFSTWYSIILLVYKYIGSKENEIKNTVWKYIRRKKGNKKIGNMRQKPEN